MNKLSDTPNRKMELSSQQTRTNIRDCELSQLNLGDFLCPCNANPALFLFTVYEPMAHAKSSRPTVIFDIAPVCSRPGERVHLPCDGLVQARAVVTHSVEVEMAAPFDVAEVGPGPEPLHRRFQQVRRTVEIEGVGRADGQVDLAV